MMGKEAATTLGAFVSFALIHPEIVSFFLVDIVLPVLRVEQGFTELNHLESSG